MKRLIFIFSLLLILANIQGQRILPGVVAGKKAAAAAVSNMLSEGNFTTKTKWSVGSPFSIGSGIASYTNVGYGYIYQEQSDMVSGITANTAYTLTYDLTISSGQANFRIRSSLTNIEYNASSYTVSGGTGLQLHFTTPADIGEGGFKIQGQPFGDNAWSIDNLVLTKD